MVPQLREAVEPAVKTFVMTVLDCCRKKLDPPAFDEVVKKILERIIFHGGPMADDVSFLLPILRQVVLVSTLPSGEQDFRVISERVKGRETHEANIRLPNGNNGHEPSVANGEGEVEALLDAYKKAFSKGCRQMRYLDISDFKIRIADGQQQEGRRAEVLALIQFQVGDLCWSATAVSTSLVGAPQKAVADSVIFAYYLLPSLNHKSLLADLLRIIGQLYDSLPAELKTEFTTA